MLKTIGLCVPRSDMYGIRFPDNATNEAKMMLIYATIFLDYLQYLAWFYININEFIFI